MHRYTLKTTQKDVNKYQKNKLQYLSLAPQKQLSKKTDIDCRKQ